MSRLTGSEAKSLMEAYNAVYASQKEVNEEFTQEELEVEIFEAIAYALISQGHTATDVLEYFASLDDEVIIEDLNTLFDETFIIEEVVSEEYIEEQMQQLDEIVGAALRLGGAALKAAKFAPKGANVGQRALSALGGAGRAATRISQQGTKASAVVRPALGRAVQGAKGAIGGAISKVKDVAKGALSKLPGGSGGKLAGAAKFVGKAALGGAAFEGGMRAVQGLMGGGKGATTKTAPVPDKALGGQTAFKAGGGQAALAKGKSMADVQKAGSQALFKAGGGQAAMGGKTRAQVMAQGSKNVAAKPTPKITPTPAAPALPRASAPAATRAAVPSTKTPAQTKPSDVTKAPSISKDVEDIKQMQQRSKQRQGQLMGGPEGPGQINKASVESDIKAAQEREKKKAQTVSASYEYDAYDLVLEYLISEGHVESISEAHYVMLEMGVETIQNIVEAQRARENPDRYERDQRSRETRGQSAERRVRDRLRTMDPEKAKQMKAQMRAAGLNV